MHHHWPIVRNYSSATLLATFSGGMASHVVRSVYGLCCRSRGLLSSSLFSIGQRNLIPSAIKPLTISISTAPRRPAEHEDGGGEGGNNQDQGTSPMHDSSKDRTVQIPVETSMRYMTSEAYKETYGDHLVWQLYRRNFKGQFPPKRTRQTCIRKGVIATGNPCPICRDEYLVLDYRNIKLLHQFLCPHTGQILRYSTTGVCRRQQRNLLAAILKARDYGYLTFHVPFREYKYEEYLQDLMK